MKQSLPAYRGVQEVYSSTSWIYFRTTGFGQHIMGPWYDTAARTIQFVNLPTNQKQVFRIPRTSTLTTAPTVKTPTYGPEDKIGYFVDGVAMCDALDGYQWNGSSEVQGGGNFYWKRAAYPNENITFDPSNTHQQNTGTYHNHANPIALRYLLGDHVEFNPTTKLYTESTSTNLTHSPIVGWVRDGLPIYGPYGYSNALSTNSVVIRMRSGYQLRDGTKGTDNMTTGGRATLPAWVLRNNGNSAASGPGVSTTYPLGRYLQDYAYLGDLTNSATGQKYQLGVDFDLNDCCARYCVTPEFPNGTYAYFITIDATGTPVAPWNVGMYFYGNATGGKWTNIVETVTTNFIGGPNTALTLNTPTTSNSVVTLTWSGVEGGTYQVAYSSNNVAFTTNVTSYTPSYTNATAITTNYTSPYRGTQYARVQRTGLANFDTAGTTATTNQSATQSFTIAVAAGQVSGLSFTGTSGASPVKVQCAGTAYFTYALQRSTNLVNWVPVNTTNLPASGQCLITDNFSGLASVPASAFYRLVSQ